VEGNGNEKINVFRANGKFVRSQDERKREMNQLKRENYQMEMLFREEKASFPKNENCQKRICL
jgi:uncharacterized protein with von Willebrand factor type A (vWA) domain